MRITTTKTLLAVLALALGLAGQASAQAPQVRRPAPPRTQKPASSGSVKVTDAPAETAPAEAAPAPAAPAPAAPAAPATGMAQGSQVREEAAITGVRDWLALVDAGQFPEAYDQAGDLFRGSLPRDQWASALGKSRTPRGNVVQRSLKSVLVTKDLANAPQGKYVVTTFETTFQQPTEPMWEIATSFLTPSGQWKVVGYTIKPQEGAAAKPSK